MVSFSQKVSFNALSYLKLIQTSNKMTNNTKKNDREPEAMDVDDNHSYNSPACAKVKLSRSGDPSDYNDPDRSTKKRRYDMDTALQGNAVPNEDKFQTNKYDEDRRNRGVQGSVPRGSRGGNWNQPRSQNHDSPFTERNSRGGNRSSSRGNRRPYNNSQDQVTQQQTWDRNDPTLNHAVHSKKPFEYPNPQQASIDYQFSQSAPTFGRSSQAAFGSPQQYYQWGNMHSASGTQQQYYQRGNMHPASRGQRSGVTESARDRDFRLSKSMAFLLRHGAVKARLPIHQDGYIFVFDLLQHKDLVGFSEADVARVVQNNNKQRFQMTTEGPTGRVKVRASQGHSIQVDDLQMEPIDLTSEETIEIVHGTYFESLEKILTKGLSRMNRNHIHFTTAEPEDRRVTSGMRSSCEVVIYVDMSSAIKDGYKFFRSANGVVLSPGNNEGILPKKYFLRIFQRNPREQISFKQ